MTAVMASIIEKLGALPESKQHEVLDFVQSLEWEATRQNERTNPSTSLRREADPLIGLFEGPPNLATQAEELLRQVATRHTGWTWKTDSL